MQTKHLTYFFLIISALTFGCREKGCTRKSALNFDSSAKKDDGSCQFADTSTAEIRFQKMTWTAEPTDDKIIYQFDLLSKCEIVEVYAEFRTGKSSKIYFKGFATEASGAYCLFPKSNFNYYKGAQYATIKVKDEYEFTHIIRDTFDVE